jgi:hypothetical protein
MQESNAKFIGGLINLKPRGGAGGENRKKWTGRVSRLSGT